MGVYLSKPIKDKLSSNHENNYLKCGASSMQGWRMSQEDAHNCCLDYDTEISLFAVYDGHGGAEVAEYASKHLPNTIKETEAYKQGDFEKALQDAFLSFDASLVTEPVLEELKKIAGNKEKNSAAAMSETEDEVEDEDDDVQGLREEAKMPLADVIARYANGTIPKTPALRRICGESSKSPFLRARAACSSSDSEVSSTCGSSGSSGSSSEVVSTNGLPESNGELTVESTTSSEESPNSPTSTSKKTEACDQVSSSTVNGEKSSSLVSSTGRVSAKRAINIYRSLLAAHDVDDESDSDENDESFSATADTSTPHSSDDDEGGEVEENGEVDEAGEDEEEEEEETEEEEEEEEDEEDDIHETDLNEKEEPGNDSGCTAVVSLVTRDRVIVANAGDSRAVLSRNGEAIDLSVDHKPEDPIELKRINAAGGRVTPDGRVNGGLNLSRALGDHMYKKSSELPATEQMITALPDIKSIDLKESEDEFIVLACDGIWNSMSSQEVVDFIRPLIAKGESLSAICEKLFDNCLAADTHGDGTGCDNMTCVIVQLFQQSELSSSKRKCETENSLEETNKRVKVDTVVGNT